MNGSNMARIPEVVSTENGVHALEIPHDETTVDTIKLLRVTSIGSGEPIGFAFIDEVLGSGGTGKVYRGTDFAGQPLAIKVPHHDSTKWIEYEAMVAQYLQNNLNPTLIEELSIQLPVYIGNIQMDGIVKPAIIQPFAPNSLEDDLKEGTFSLEAKLAIIRQFAYLMDKSLELNIIIGDLKPENVRRIGRSYRLTDLGGIIPDEEYMYNNARVFGFQFEELAAFGVLGAVPPEVIAFESIKLDGFANDRSVNELIQNKVVYNFVVFAFQVLNNGNLTWRTNETEGGQVRTVNVGDDIVGFFKLFTEGKIYPVVELDNLDNAAMQALAMQALALDIELRFGTCEEFVSKLEEVVYRSIKTKEA